MTSSIPTTTAYSSFAASKPLFEALNTRQSGAHRLEPDASINLVDAIIGVRKISAKTVPACGKTEACPNRQSVAARFKKALVAVFSRKKANAGKENEVRLERSQRPPLAKVAAESQKKDSPKTEHTSRLAALFSHRQANQSGVRTIQAEPATKKNSPDRTPEEISCIRQQFDLSKPKQLNSTQGDTSESSSFYFSNKFLQDESWLSAESACDGVSDSVSSEGSRLMRSGDANDCSDHLLRFLQSIPAPQESLSSMWIADESMPTSDPYDSEIHCDEGNYYEIPEELQPIKNGDRYSIGLLGKASREFAFVSKNPPRHHDVSSGAVSRNISSAEFVQGAAAVIEITARRAAIPSELNERSSLSSFGKNVDAIQQKTMRPAIPPKPSKEVIARATSKRSKPLDQWRGLTAQPLTPDQPAKWRPLIPPKPIAIKASMNKHQALPKN